MTGRSPQSYSVRRAVLLFCLGLMVGLCYLAYQGGRQEAYQQEWEKVGLNQVLGTGWCDGDGQPWYVIRYLQENDVLKLHCTDGFVATVPKR